MAASKLNAKSPTIRRILREAAELSNSPSPDYFAEPLESDLFEWHFTLKGPPNSVYGDGVYHGRIILPSAYPLRPPNFRFMTPNGRFEANREICLSISGHHEETWQPAWGVRTALVALRSFMETDPRGQLGGLETTEDVRKRLAAESASFKCPTCGKTNSEIIKECEERAQDAAGSSQEEVEIPKELNMGWKDEMETAKKQSAAPGTSSDEEQSAELAEGFVQTVPATVHSAPVSTSSDIHHDPPTAPVAVSPSSPDTGIPTTTRAVAAPVPAVRNAAARQPVPVIAVQQPRRASDDGVPLWVDRTIVVLVVLLIALVLKVVFSG